jgi:hypothetical protein
MIKFGIPIPAIKIKMISEGYDPNIIDVNK